MCTNCSTKTDWQERERQRFADGTYKAVPVTLAYPPEHHLHLSTSATETDTVAYTPSEQYGVMDRQVRLKFGRYLKKTFDGLSDAEVQGHVTALRSALALAESAPVLHFTTDKAKITEIFETEMRACDSLCASCMYGKFTGKHRPYHVYAGSPDVAVAYAVVAGRGITARSVVSTKGKEWVRLYSVADGESSTDCGVLQSLLKSAGYSEGNLIGCRLTKLDTADVMLPYIDNGGMGVWDKGSYWVVCEEGEGDYTADCTDGTATENVTRCEGCREPEDECECIWCDCCEERYYGGRDRCNTCERCEGCVTHDRCECDRCTECGRFTEAGRYESRCECDRCSECSRLEYECECAKCETCERLTGDCECKKEPEASEVVTANSPGPVESPETSVPSELTSVARYLLREYAGLGTYNQWTDSCRESALISARGIVSDLEHRFMTGGFAPYVPEPEMVLPATAHEARHKLNRAYLYLRDYPGQVWDRNNGIWALMVAAVERIDREGIN